MATSLTGPPGAERASPTAPLPRLPLPMSASRTVLSSPAWTCGTTAPAKIDMAPSLAVFFKKSRRGVAFFAVLLMAGVPR